MTAQPREAMDVEEFLVWLDAHGDQGHRHELVDGLVVVCQNGTVRHDELVLGVYRALLRARGETDPCRTYPFRSLRTSRGLRSPDLLVTCRPPGGRVEEDADFVVEVLSASTGVTDLTAKVREYTRLPSLQQYLVLDPEPDEPFGYLFTPTELGHHTQTVQSEVGFAGVALDLAAVYAQLPPSPAPRGDDHG